MSPKIPIKSPPKKVRDALKNFDLLPDFANARQPAVQGLYCCSAATVWRMVGRGLLSAPSKLADRVTAWNVGELRAVVAKGYPCEHKEK